MMTGSGPHPLQSLLTHVQEDPDAAAGNLPDLLRYLEMGTPDERGAASQVLVELASRRPAKVISSLDRLVPLLRGRQPRVVVNVSATFAYVSHDHTSAIVALGRDSRAAPLDALAGLLDSDSTAAKWNAAEALAHVAQDFPEKITDALNRPGFSGLFDEGDEPRRHALAICARVAEIDPDRVHPHLGNVRRCLSKDFSTDERVTAVVTLGRLAVSSPGLVVSDMEPLLSAARDRDPAVRGNALGAAVVLADTHPNRMRDLRAVAADVLDDGNFIERVNAAELLYKLAGSHPDRVAPVRERLERARDTDPEPMVQTYAEMALLTLSGETSSASSDIGTVVRDTLERTEFGSLVQGALRPIIHIEELYDDHQSIEVSGENEIGGDLGNQRHREVESSRRDRDRNVSGDADRRSR